MRKRNCDVVGTQVKTKQVSSGETKAEAVVIVHVIPHTNVADNVFVFWFLYHPALLSLCGVQNKQGKEKPSPVLDLFDIRWG